ncbi:hypothetical protein [Streptomyces yaizuensis]|uniref:Uncharacterized protein n=1 Tax=Streptomyces yaizuensis TaxID=2989713 RepID=A0ABQ5P198_9ACTN|nr:hypothetical protein [Streptomyces sp. YSPA8]GLF95976.1 hypothetical protein SYYSPA8_16785 [Streptomyces sp. YSPA8]
MPSRLASEKISGSVMALTAGLVADMSATALFLASPGVRNWLKEEYALISLTTILLFATVVVVANIAFSARGKIHELQAEIESLTSRLTTPSEHDTEMFRAINEKASPQSPFVTWFRECFIATRIPAGPFQSLEKMIDFFDREPRGFIDNDVDDSYRALIGAGSDLINKISDHMWYEGRENSRLEIPREWELNDPQRFEGAMNEIREAREAFIASYDAFFMTAQTKGLSSVISASVQ